MRLLADHAETVHQWKKYFPRFVEFSGVSTRCFHLVIVTIDTPVSYLWITRQSNVILRTWIY
jgi:hypothetical protein